MKHRKQTIFTVYLSARGPQATDAYAELNLPATAEQFSDAFDKARASETNCTVELADCKHELLRDYISDDPSIYELNHFADRLTELNEEDELFFEALVSMEKEPPDLARMINLTYNTDGCIIAGVSSYEELGKFAVEGGFLPELDTLDDRTLGLLDYAAIGRRFMTEQNGVFVNGCFVANIESTENVRCPYNGSPPKPDLNPDHLFRLEYGDGERLVVLELPASENEINLAVEKIAILGLRDTIDFSCHSSIPRLDELITARIDIDELSAFAETLQYIHNCGDLPKFKAVLEHCGCTNFEACVLIADRLDDFDFDPKIVSAFDYGEYELLREYGLNKECPGMRHFDFAAFGKERLEQHGATLTAYGSVCFAGPKQTMPHHPPSQDGGMNMG